MSDILLEILTLGGVRHFWRVFRKKGGSDEPPLVTGLGHASSFSFTCGEIPSINALSYSACRIRCCLFCPSVDHGRSQPLFQNNYA